MVNRWRLPVDEDDRRRRNSKDVQRECELFLFLDRPSPCVFSQVCLRTSKMVPSPISVCLRLMINDCRRRQAPSDGQRKKATSNGGGGKNTQAGGSSVKMMISVILSITFNMVNHPYIMLRKCFNSVHVLVHHTRCN
ncbi:hypothetical protein EUGRSUZ_D01262 [Eucalyptus grandis]|uniref:Uncharacterized protein n=2 Tax=Eucalyptus grandis TaxID=71139 RepID=A0ACC3L5W5_EUCGR|nr:hypothetical protein EUGRSUZ_D01262 [Eucalyptus grandis]